MWKIVFGIDPDAELFGVAVYIDGKIDKLYQIDMPEIIRYAVKLKENSQVIFSIENVMANKFIYARNVNKSKAIEGQIAMRVGRCQQAQVELQRWLDFYSIPYVLHSPQKGNWADNKAQFEAVTGWKERSNADTRAAAFFGYLAIGK
jgi:hypothetical protein